MNRNLLIFALLLIFVGFGVGFYLISFFGLLLLIPALLSPTRVPSRPTPAPEPPKPQPRRITTRPAKQPEGPMAAPTAPPMEGSVSAPMPSRMAAPSYQSQSIVYTPPLFPTTMFPSLSGMAGTPAPPPREPEHERRREENDLLEVVGLLVLLRLVSG